MPHHAGQVPTTRADQHSTNFILNQTAGKLPLKDRHSDVSISDCMSMCVRTFVQLIRQDRTDLLYRRMITVAAKFHDNIRKYTCNYMYMIVSALMHRHICNCYILLYSIL